MNRFRISRLAEKDLEDIWIYLAQQSEILADHELQTGLRSFPVKPYIIFYTQDSESLEIVRIFHQSRDIENQFLDDDM